VPIQFCFNDGLIVARLGVLDNDLGKVWQPNQPHVAVRQLRDWFKAARAAGLGQGHQRGAGAVGREVRDRG
jgi:hypothetical protein